MTYDENKFVMELDVVFNDLKTMLVSKNLAYGNSVLEPIRIFSKADALEQIKVRIDDKLSRLMHGKFEGIPEDTIGDLIGYLIILKIAGKQEALNKISSIKKLPIKIHEPELIPDTTNNLLIPKFEYDHSLRKEIEGYSKTWYVELPDGRVVVGYDKASYFTTKENVLTIPYPTPFGYFNDKIITTSARTPLKAYRGLLDKRKTEPIPDPIKTYVGKSTLSRIKELAEQKKLKETETESPEKIEMSEKTKKLREMTIKMGIQ